MKDKDIHEEEVTEHDNGNIHKVVCDKNGCQQTFGVCEQIADFPSEGWLPSSISFRSEGESEKKAISDAEAKPEASRSKPARIMAIIADNEGVFTDIPLKISANWHK